MQISIKIFLVFILLMPYFIIFFSSFESFTILSFPVTIFYRNFIQAFWSALICLIIGFLGALGLTRYKNKPFLEVFILLPSFFPSLFVIFSLLTVFSLLPFDFPYGLSGIVIAHVMIYSGLACIMLARAFKESCGSQIFLAQTFGHSQKNVLFHVLLPNIKRDLFTIFITLFCLCLGSFSIPLVLGGGKWVTTEMAIYEFIRFEGDLTSAAFLSFYQIFILLFFIYFIPHIREKKITLDDQDIGSKWFICLPIFITLALICSCFIDLIAGWSSFTSILFDPLLLLKSFGGTFLVSFLTGCMILFLLNLIAFVGPSAFLDKFYLLFMMPSTAVMGSSLLFLSYYFEWTLRSLLQAAFLTSLGLSLLFLGGLYRWKWSGEIFRLVPQRQLAKLMGHSYWSIFLHVIWPQSKYLAFHLAGLAAFWAAGDFALSLMIFKDGSATLGLLLNSMISSYRFKGAAWILLFILLSGFLMWFCFFIVSRVKKSSYVVN